jgi:hypothetical protein
MTFMSENDVSQSADETTECIQQFLAAVTTDTVAATTDATAGVDYYTTLATCASGGGLRKQPSCR